MRCILKTGKIKSTPYLKLAALINNTLNQEGFMLLGFCETGNRLRAPGNNQMRYRISRFFSFKINNLIGCGISKKRMQNLVIQGVACLIAFITTNNRKSCKIDITNSIQ